MQHVLKSQLERIPALVWKAILEMGLCARVSECSDARFDSSALQGGELLNHPKAKGSTYL